MRNTALLIFVNIFLWNVVYLYSSSTQDKVPLDTSVRHGKLANGLAYYIKPINNGTSEMELQLLLRAGSAVQDADQYEFSHIMEHVAFKAGKHMTMAKANSIGFQPGQINGSSSFDLTQYYFQSVKTKEEREVAFQLFQDIIWDLQFKRKFIDNERSVVINEKAIRGGFKANSILIDMESAMTGRGPNRPKDFVTYIKSFPKRSLKRYYKDWYRPDLMAIIIVGDFDNTDEIEKEIKEKFSKAKQVGRSRSPDKNYDKYISSSPKFISKEHPFSTKDSKKQAVYLRLYMRQNNNLQNSGPEFLKNDQLKQLFLDMLSNRISETLNFYNSTFHISPDFMNPPSLGLEFHITVEEGAIKGPLLKTIGLLRQLKENGFTEQEFSKSKKKYLDFLSKIDTEKVSYWVDNLREYFVYGKALPHNKTTISKNLINNLNLEEFNQFATQYIKTKPEDLDIIMLAPRGHIALSYSEKLVREWISEANNLFLAPYKPPLIPNELISDSQVKTLKIGAVQEKTVSIPGATEYLFDNGVRLLLKPLDSLPKENEQHKISFLGFTMKGIDCYPSFDYFSAMNAANIVYNSGVGGINKFELKRYFKDKSFNGTVFPYISYNEAGIKGYVSLKELETALQLVYLYMKEPNRDSLAFKDWKLRANSSYSLHSINMEDFRASIKMTLGDQTFLPKGTKALKGLSETDMDRAYEIYRDLFGNAKDFTFIFTGDFQKEEVLSLCRKYLGNLPVSPVQNKCEIPLPLKKHDLPKASSVVIHSKDYMQDVKVQLEYISNLNTKDLEWEEDMKLKLLQSLMNFSIMQKMRFDSNEKGGTYNISVLCNLEKPRLFNEFIVSFSCSPEDVDQLIKETKQFVKSFKENTVDKELLKRNINTRGDYLVEEVSDRIVILGKIHDYYRYGKAWPMMSLKQKQAYLKAITPEDIKNVAQRLLQGDPLEFRMVSRQILP